MLGGIDLDPASCAKAQETVKARKFFTRENDGLVQPWFGRVFLNPPYGDLMPSFVRKTCESYNSGQIDEAIILANAHSLDSSWFQPLWNGVLCFTDGRINFISGVGKESKQCTHGSVFCYLGPHDKKFREVFRQFGRIVKAVDR